MLSYHDGERTGVGGSSVFLDMPLAESAPRSPNGVGGKGTSGGLVHGGVTRRRLGDIDMWGYLEWKTDSSEEDVGTEPEICRCDRGREICIREEIGDNGSAGGLPEGGVGSP